jgi:hypothetical protein
MHVSRAPLRRPRAHTDASDHPAPQRKHYYGAHANAPPSTPPTSRRGQNIGEIASQGGMRARQRAVFGLTGSVCIPAPTLPPNSQIQNLI